MKTLCYLNLLYLLPYCMLLHLPGLAPVNYCKEEIATKNCPSKVPLYVYRLTSEESSIHYEYSHFDFCIPDEYSSPVQNMEQVYAGESIKPSMYNISFLKEKQCVSLCQKTYQMDVKEDVEKLHRLKDGMLKNYQHHWIIDNIPVTWCNAVEGGEQYCSKGFPMGCYVDSDHHPKDACVMNTAFHESDTFYLFNHVDLRIFYQSNDAEPSGMGSKETGGRIIRIKVLPRSIKHESGKSCNFDLPPLSIPNKLNSSDIITVNYTYSVSFVKILDAKLSGWDVLESKPDTDIHWFSMLNMLVIILLTTGVLAMILLRALHKGTSRYNQFDSRIAKKLSPCHSHDKSTSQPAMVKS